MIPTRVTTKTKQQQVFMSHDLLILVLSPPDYDDEYLNQVLLPTIIKSQPTM